MKKTITTLFVMLASLFVILDISFAHHLGNNPFYGNTNEDMVHSGTDYDPEEWDIEYTDPENRPEDTGNPNET